MIRINNPVALLFNHSPRRLLDNLILVKSKNCWTISELIEIYYKTLLKLNPICPRGTCNILFTLNKIHHRENILSRLEQCRLRFIIRKAHLETSCQTNCLRERNNTTERTQRCLWQWLKYICLLKLANSARQMVFSCTCRCLNKTVDHLSRF